jgi:serine/threonine protein kinase
VHKAYDLATVKVSEPEQWCCFRFVLLALLGRGGFSEVHKAYDLASLKFVAVKVRRLVHLSASLLLAMAS